MKVIVAGSRWVNSYETVCMAIEASGFEITELVSGTCRGVDRLGERWANERGIPVKPFPAQWQRRGGQYDSSAGPARNQQMAEYVGPDGGLVAVWMWGSRGTSDMIKRFLTIGKQDNLFIAFPALSGERTT